MPSGAARRLTAAALPVAAVAFAWASLASVAASRSRSSRSPRPRCLASLPTRLRSRVAVAVLVLLGLTVAVAGATPAAVRDVVRRGAAGHLRGGTAVRRRRASRAPRARPPGRCGVLPRHRGHGRQPAVRRRRRHRGRGRLGGDDPARPEHGRDGRARAARRAVAGGRRRRPRSARARSRRCGRWPVSSWPRRWRPAPGRGPRSPRSTGRAGICSASRAPGERWRSSGARTTAASTSRPRRRRCCGSRRRAVPSTGGRRPSTASPATAGSSRSTRRRAAPAQTGRSPGPAAPAAAASRAGWVKQEVEVRALVDDHVIAAGAADGDRRRRRPADPLLSAAASCWPSGGRRADAPLHGLELRAGADARRARALAAGLPATRSRATSTSGARSCRRSGHRGRAAAVSAIFDDDRYQQLWPYEALWREARRLTAKSRSPVRGDDPDRALAALGRRVQLRRAPAAAAGAAAARRLPRADEARLLPAVRRDDGADAALPRDPGPRRRRLHERDVEGRRAGR